MNDTKPQDRTKQLVLAYQLDAPPEKVWRALSIPEFRETWLPAEALAEADSIGSVPGEEVRYRLKDDEPPFLESVVTFQLRPNAGGTERRIIHRLTDASLGGQRASPANSNQCLSMRAA
jgi:uncharacterized protein YndB with AHSA1/START domain